MIMWSAVSLRIRDHGSTRSPSHGSTTGPDRKSTRLNSSHGYISYAVFCLKKKNDSLSRADPPTPAALVTGLTGAPLPTINKRVNLASCDHVPPPSQLPLVFSWHSPVAARR